MPSRLVTSSVGHAASRVPGLRRVPVVTLLSLAEVGMMARERFMRLTPAERRRLLELIRTARGRPRNLSTRERLELARLTGRLEPRLLAGEAVKRLSPLPLPRRIVQGPKRSRGSQATR